MEQDQIITAIENLLDSKSPAIDPTAATKLTLAITSQLYIKVQELDKKLDLAYSQTTTDMAVLRERVSLLEKSSLALINEVNALKDISIVLWVQRHPKIATFIFSAMIVVALFAVELRTYILALLGLKSP